MNYPWILKSVALAVHDRQISEHGGTPGIRDEGALEAALARPQNLLAYGKSGVFDLAAGYAYGIARNHPFVDGNKRVAFVTSAMFLRLCGFQLTAPPADRVRVFSDLAAGAIDQDGLAAWFEANSSPVSKK